MVILVATLAVITLTPILCHPSIASSVNRTAPASRFGIASAHIWNITPNSYRFSYSLNFNPAAVPQINTLVSAATVFSPAAEQSGPRRAYLCNSNPRYLSDQKFIVT
jgi:hypothetical protein